LKYYSSKNPFHVVINKNIFCPDIGKPVLRAFRFFARPDIEPRLLPFKGAEGGLAVTNRIFRRRLHGPCGRLPVFFEPGLGFLPAVYKSRGISGFTPAMDKAIN
jgi:hypothetical protein